MTDRQTDGQTDGRTEFTMANTALSIAKQAMLTRCNKNRLTTKSKELTVDLFKGHAMLLVHTVA